MRKAFTLIELIVVIIIVGILAALGLTQYSKIVEKSRLAEARIRIGTMRQLAYEYYLNNGTLATITNPDVGVDATCHSTDFYKYTTGSQTAGSITVNATRCTSGGKTPNATRGYVLYQMDYADSTTGPWRCQYLDDSTSCFGYPP